MPGQESEFPLDCHAPSHQNFHFYQLLILSLRGSPRSPVSSAHEPGERRRSSSPNVLSSLRCNTASQTGGSTSLFAKSLASGRPCAKRSDEAPAEPRLAERARAQTSLRAESFGAALARARRWGSDRLSCSSRSSAGGSGSHSMLSRGYLDRMRGMGARQSSATSPVGTSRASRDVAVQAQSCVSTMSSLGLDTVASVADTLPANGKAGIQSPRTPNLTLPQMGAVAMAGSTESATARVHRLRVEVRKPREDVQVHSPGRTRSPQSPQVRLASPRMDLQSNSRGVRHNVDPVDPVDLARAFVHGQLNGANPHRNDASKVGPRIETRLVTSVETEKATAMEAMETETKAVSAVSEDVASRLHHSEPVVRQAAAAALGALGEVAAEHVRQLASLIEDVDSGVRRAAAIALGNLGQRAVGHADALLAASQLDDDDDVRFHAAVALGMLGATSKVARCRSNGRSKQHVPAVLA
eukprot:s1441_g22.t1